MVRLAKSSETSNDRMQEPQALAWLKVWMMMMMMMMMMRRMRMMITTIIIIIIIWLVVSTQPIWKICSSKWGHLSQVTGWKQIFLKSLPSYYNYHNYHYYCWNSDDIVFLRQSRQALIQGCRNPVVELCSWKFGMIVARCYKVQRVNTRIYTATGESLMDLGGMDFSHQKKGSKSLWGWIFTHETPYGKLKIIPPRWKKNTFGSSWRVFFPILNKAHGVRVGGKRSHHSMNQHVKVTVDGWNPWPAIYETIKKSDILRVNWCWFLPSTVCLWRLH